ncbi:MAG: hypothetical protein MUF12_00995 [Sediminibacterium sp.]|jgi:hypothetical protein|nr:hypothetical protein [Sediminibacterium sp.]
MKNFQNSLPQDLTKFPVHLTEVPALGFSPIIQCDSFFVEEENEVYSFNFNYLPNHPHKLRLMYAWIPPQYRCCDLFQDQNTIKISLKKQSNGNLNN